jgi:ribonuclease HI
MSLLTFNKKKSKININRENCIKIYCDGGSSPNPGETGSGIVIYKNSNEKPRLFYGKYLKEGTNNIGELEAMYNSLKYIKKYTENDTFVKIFSDSKYVINSITIWAKKWELKNWKKKKGIKNLELMKKNYYLYNELSYRIELEHVKSHTGIEGNELADSMVWMARNKKQEKLIEYIYSSINEVISFRDEQLDSYFQK